MTTPPGRRRILALASRVPYPLIGGDRLRVYHLLQALAPDHDVSLVALHEGRDTEAARSHLGGFLRDVEIVPVSPWGCRRNALAGRLLRAQPLQVGYYHVPGLRDHLLRRATEFDLVLCFHVRMAEYAAGLAMPRILDLVDAISMNYERALVRMRNPAWRTVYRMELPVLRSYELACIRSFERSWVISPVDREHLISRGAPAERLAVVPNGTSYIESDLRANEPEDIDVLFHGHLGTQSNEAAARFLIGEVLPILRTTHPQVRCVLAGTSPSRRLRRLAQDCGAEVTGEVPSMEAYVRRARVVVAPMTFGAGVQNKILEAMALAKPVVLSTVGAEGIDGQHGVHYLVADQPPEFAAAVSALLRSAEYRRALGSQARELVRRTFTWPAIRRLIAAELELLLGPTAAGTRSGHSMVNPSESPT